MPQIKRSKRIQNKRKRKSIENKTNRSPPETSPSNSNTCINDLNVKEESQQTCFACSQIFAPIRRYRKTEWIQCDQCDNWWHAECACITVEDIDKLKRHCIGYTCALCVLKGSAWILKNHTLSDLSLSEKEKQEIKPVPDKQDCYKENQDCSKQLPITDKRTVSERQKCVVVVDNIKSPQKFRSSIEIRKETNRFADIKPKLSFSLPKGGVALEFDNKEQADKILNNWPSDAFGKDSQCHSPLGRKKTVGFLKNIPIHIKSSQLQDIYSNTCTVKSIRRLVFRSTHKPMPVVRIEFQTEEDFEKAKSTVIHYSTNGKPTFLEAERPFKLIRCYNCHRIGHIGRACLYESRCGNCSATDHTDNDCNKQSKCPNCDGNHHASSNICPTYQHILQLHRNQLLL